MIPHLFTATRWWWTAGSWRQRIFPRTSSSSRTAVRWAYGFSDKGKGDDAPLDFSHHLFISRRVDSPEAASQLRLRHELGEISGNRHDVPLEDSRRQPLLKNSDN